MSTQVTENIKVSNTTLVPILDPQPILSKKPTSSVSQKIPVVKKRRYVALIVLLVVKMMLIII